MTFDELLVRRQWKPITNCPGRFVLVTSDRFLTVETLLAGDCKPRTFTSVAAHDPVIVVALKDGGVISYARQDGSFVHTLNTPDGFARKLAQLGITLDSHEH